MKNVKDLSAPGKGGPLCRGWGGLRRPSHVRLRLWLPLFWITLQTSVCCWGQTAPTATDSPSPTVSATDWEVGIDGVWKVGYWTEVSLDLTASADVEGTLTLVAPDGESAMVRYEDPSRLRLAQGETRRVRRLVKVGRLSGPLQALFQAVDEVNQASTRGVQIGATRLEDHDGLSSQQPVLLSVGGEEALSNLALQRQLEPTEVRPATSLPSRWESLSAMDVIWVVADPRVELTSAQRRALSLWNRLGGHLVLCGADAAVSLGEGGDWSGMTPGTFGEPVERRFGGGVEQLAGANERLPRFRAASVRLQDPNRQLLATVGSGSSATPVIARAPHGLGIVTYVGLSLSEEPFASWGATNDLIRQILELPGAARQRQQRSVGSVRYVGYDDLSGQMRSALDRFQSTGGAAGVGLISFSLVVLILVVYAALLGPGDYFLLRKLQAFEWTWLTFPLLVLALLAGLALLRGKLKSSATLMNQLDIVDIDVPSGLVRATHWAQAYSPKTTTWELTAAPRVAIANLAPASSSSLLLSWQGLPGGALGGMESRSTAGLLQEGYRARLDAQTLSDVPVRTGSSRSFSAAWWAERKFDGVSSLTGRNGVLEGRLSSPLSVDLRDCALFYNNSVYLFDGARLAAGETVLVQDLPLRRDMSWRLNQRRLARAADTRYTNTPWDPESRNVSRIVEMLMFYNAAGGEGYTRMQHRYQGRLDGSAQLKMGRAVLIGRAEIPATQLSINDADGPGQKLDAPGQKLAYYRIVYPVTQRKRGER